MVISLNKKLIVLLLLLLIIAIATFTYMNNSDDSKTWTVDKNEYPKNE